VLVPNLSGARSITLGFFESCAILAGGTVSCWGYDAYGQLGTAPNQASNCAGEICLPSPTPVLGLTGVVQVALSTAVGCALRGDGTVWCWGSNYQGTLGRGSDGGVAFQPPGPVPGIYDALAIAGGSFDHMCAIRADRTVWCWGRNNVGETGQPVSSNEVCPSTSPVCTNTPAPVPGLFGARELAVGYTHSCAITMTDALYCWGNGSSGQLGRDPTLLDTTSVPGASFSSDPFVVDLPPVAHAAAGEDHTCALLKSGGVRCWGSNSVGQLGVDPMNGGPDGGPLGSSWVPVSVNGL
jgi:alpha-tubulin suppressor-like RCC1 family protein